MKKIHYSLLIVLLSALISSTALADGHEAKEGLKIVPVEIFICNYNKGKDQDDLDKLLAKWNAWMDEIDAKGYSAWTYTAYYNSPDYEFDVAWMGVWPDGKTMGESTDQWLSAGGEMGAEFAKVLDCPVHSNFATTKLRGPEDDGRDTAVIEFADCKYKEGTKFADALAAAHEWNAYMTEQGSVASEYWFFPVYGGDPEWHFKLVNGYSNYAELGADYDRYGNGGGYMKAQEILSDAYRCGVSRVYNAKRVRNGMAQ